MPCREIYIQFNKEEGRTKFSKVVLVYLLWNLAVDFLTREGISQRADGFKINVGCKNEEQYPIFVQILWPTSCPRKSQKLTQSIL